MKYRLTKGALEEHEEERVTAIITARSSRGELLTEEEIVKELGANKEVVREVIRGLVIKGKIEEVNDIPRLTPTT